MAKKGQKFTKMSLEIRLEAVMEKIQKGKSFGYLGKKYGVSRKIVESWVRIYKRDNGLDISKKGRPKQEANIDYKERYEILYKYQDYLGEVGQEKK